LLLAGTGRDAAPGDRIIREGEAVHQLAIPISGTVAVSRNGQRLGNFESGQMMGLALALTGEASTFDAAFIERGRYMSWPLPSLRRFLDRRPELRIALQKLASHDLARKVEGLMPRHAPAS
jgi:CRP-like cAMP-binding protein